jgi:membrane-bound lytic murein transglycosylase D
VLVDDGVVARLNQWISVPRTRENMVKAMERMPSYRGMIEQSLRARHLPVELLGMVMAESAFDNEAHPNVAVEKRSVGIWQIIPSTGRELGLQISPVLDERLEPRRATEAAATIMTHLFDRYRDWPVAIAAYNAGEKKVDALAAGAGSPAEVRARVLAGEDEHARYVRAVMASLILIDNPALLE